MGTASGEPRLIAVCVRPPRGKNQEGMASEILLPFIAPRSARRRIEWSGSLQECAPAVARLQMNSVPGPAQEDKWKRKVPAGVGRDTRGTTSDDGAWVQYPRIRDQCGRKPV